MSRPQFKGAGAAVFGAAMFAVGAIAVGVVMSWMVCQA